MKLLRVLSLLLTVNVSAACGGASSPPTSVGTPAPVAVDPADARRWVSEGAVLLDVSPAERHASETRIDGAINIPLDDLDTRMSELPRDRILVVYCGRGRGSPMAVERLTAAGYDARLLGPRARWFEGLEAPEAPPSP